MNMKRGISTALAAAIGSTGFVGGAVLAQQSAVLEEVVVTARRYEESITDAPVAVNVMNADYLRNQGVQHVYDILELTPGATWGEFAAAQPSFTVRGVTGGNLGNASLESAFQLVVDGIPQTKAFMMTPPPYDLQRVEVMRGPQGTTFGRNATLGLMHFVTARPQREFDAQVNTTFGQRSLFGVDGFITGPLSDDVSIRLAFRRHEHIYQISAAVSYTGDKHADRVRAFPQNRLLQFIRRRDALALPIRCFVPIRIRRR